MDEYHQFAKRNNLSMLNDTELSEALDIANAEHDLGAAACTFRNEIKKVLRIEKDKQLLSKGTWVRTLEEFLIKLYPLARLSLRVTGALAQVTSILLILKSDNKGSQFHAYERSCRHIRNNFTGSSLHFNCGNFD